MKTLTEKKNVSFGKKLSIAEVFCFNFQGTTYKT